MNYNFICANCGNEWKEETDRTKTCPDCGSLDIVIQYDDINKKIFSEIQGNIERNEQFTWHCKKCGAKKILFGNHSIIHNVACYNGCNELMVYMSDDILDRLIKQRKRHRMSQTELAKMFGISRPVYTRIEAGEHEVPADLLLKINAFLNRK